MTAGVFLYSFYDLSSIAIRIFMLCYIPQRHSPTTAMSWLLAIYFWPWMGFLLYIAFGSTALPRERIERHEALLRSLTADKATFRRILDDESHWLPEELVRFGALGKKLGDMCITTGNSFLLIDREEDFLNKLCADIDGAKESVHLLYYIFALDSMTERLFASLEGAAARGAECRLLVDALGAKPFLKKDASRLRSPACGWRRPFPPDCSAGRPPRPGTT